MTTIEQDVQKQIDELMHQPQQVVVQQPVVVTPAPAVAQQFTLQQVLAELNKAKARLLPAVMADSEANGHLLTAFIKKNKLAPTAENFYFAISSIYRSIDWTTPPAKLVLERPVAAAESPLAHEKARSESMKVVDARDAKIAADAVSLKQCRAAISAYTPVSRRGIDYREQQESQTRWTATLNKVIAEKGNLQTFFKALVIVIQKRYDDLEAKRQRL
jgi:hypothetical protein